MQTIETNKIKIINDDCIIALKTIQNNSIDLIIADPPYFGVVKDNWDNRWNTTLEYLEWSKLWISECIRILKPSGSFYCWGGIGEKTKNMIHLILLIDSLGLYFKDMITWKKRRGFGSRKGYLYAREECVWYVKDNKQFIWNEKYQYNEEPNEFTKGFTGYSVKSKFKRIPSIWTDIPEILTRNSGDKKDKKHYTPKPHKAIQRIIQLHTTNQDQIVLDPFLGSGTTGEVCNKLNQKFIGIEINEQYYLDCIPLIFKDI